MRVVLSSTGPFHTYALAKQLKAKGYLERLFTGYPLYKVDDDLKDKTTSFPYFTTLHMALNRYNIHNLDRPLNYLASNMLDWYVANNLPDCDIFVGWSGQSLQSFKVAKERNIKTVVERGSAHIKHQNSVLAEEYARFGQPYKEIADWTIKKELEEYETADLIFVPSTYALNTFVEEGISENKLAKILLATDLTIFYPIPKKDDIFRVVYVGSLSIRKGIIYLLEAVKKLDNKNIELVLIGNSTPDIANTLDKYQNYFTYLGAISKNDLSYYNSQASVFVLPSVEDGFGLVMAEAMACGLPVIATEHTGAPDIVEDGVNGFVVPIRDADAIAEKISYLFDNPEVLASMSEAALQTFQNVDGWDAYGDQIVEIYKSILE